MKIKQISLEKFLYGLQQKTLLKIVLTCLALLAFQNINAQIKEGDTYQFFTCKNRTETYVYYGGSDKTDNTCSVTWTVDGGVFQGILGGSNQTTFDTNTDSSTGVSKVDVKWTTDNPTGIISVSSNCNNGSSSQTITFQQNSTKLTATPTPVNAGAILTLKATTAISATSITWTSTTDGNLVTNTGATVTAKPLSPSTYTSSIVFPAVYKVNTVAVKTIPCATVTSLDVNVIIPPITNNLISTLGTMYFNDNSGLGISINPDVISGATAMGGTTPITYQWQSKSRSSGFSSISGATALNYDPSNITETTSYRRVAQSTTAKISYSSAVAFTILSANTIKFEGVGAGTNKYYYVRPSTPPNIIGTLPTGTDLTLSYRWEQSNDGNIYNVVTGSDPLINTSIPTSQTTYYVRETNLSDSNGNIVYSAKSNILIAYFYDPISNNTICCDQTVAGLNTPSAITGSSPIGGGTALTSRWQISTDGTTWGYANNSTTSTYQPDKGLTGKLYVRRVTNDNTPTPNTNISNIITITYTNTISKGAAITNPIEIPGLLTADCYEDIESVNSLNGYFSNNFGGTDNDVYFKLSTNGALFGAYSCNSSVSTKLYLFNSNYQLITAKDIRSNCEFYQYDSGPTVVYYILMEGNGNLKLHIGSYVYSDCADGYTLNSTLTSPSSRSLTSSFSNSNNLASIYPNPASTKTTIVLSDEPDKSIKRILIIDKNSKIVKNVETTECQIQLSVSDLKSDIYIVNIITSKGTKKVKLAIKN